MKPYSPPKYVNISKNGDGNWHSRSGHTFKLIPNDEPPDRLQPHNIEAEQNTLGSLLLEPRSISRVSTFLNAQDFYIERHQRIYDAVLSLYQEDKPADLLLICKLLKEREQLEGIGEDYLTELMNNTYSSIHLEYYAHIVEETAADRRLIESSIEIVQLAYQPGQMNEKADRAESIIFKATSRRSVRDLVTAKEAADNLLDNIEAIKENGKPPGIPTGLTDLDRLIGGLYPSDMVVLAGRPGMGKTSLALSIALNIAKKRLKRVAIFSLEMSQLQITNKNVSSLSGIDSNRLRIGNIHEQEWTSFYRAINEHSQLPLFIDDTPAISVLELKTKARRLQAQYGLDLLIIDYLQLMRGNGEENRQQEISTISRGIKGLAKELNIPILALSQLSREVEKRGNKRPILSDLRESGSIEQDADIVMFLYCDDLYNPDTEFPNITEIIVSKHRAGPTGVLSVYHRKHLGQFIDLEVRTQPLDY